MLYHLGVRGSFGRLAKPDFYAIVANADG